MGDFKLGPKGSSIPEGGNTGQVLKKLSDEDGDYGWGDGGGEGNTNWGSVGGNISDQTDLQNALNAKANSSHNHDSVYAATNHNHDASYEPKNSNIQAHIAQPHAPANAQKNSDITKAEIEAKLTGEISSHTHPGGGGEAFPVGSIFISVVSTDPSTLLGYGTWIAFAAGRMLVGLDSGDASFDTVKETGGAKTHALTEAEIPSHTHVQNSHNHTQDAHTHIQNSHNHTQDAHTHVQDPHTHVQNAHTHVITSQTATTGSATSYEHGVLDTSSTEAEVTEVTGSTTATNQNTTAVNQNATATNQATTATNQNTTATNQAATATNQNTGGGQAHNNLPPYITVFMWERTV